MLFDYGNVLCQPQPAADTQAMAAVFDLPLARFAVLYWQFRIEYDAASLDDTAYWSAMAREVSRTLTPEQIAQLTEIDSRSWTHPAPVMPQWSCDLRAAGLQTAVLSNMPVPVRDAVLRCAWLPKFDSLTFSCDVGVCKPEPKIYLDCLEKLDAAPGEILFLDDREANVRAAEALGLHAVLFTQPDQAAREIEGRFSLPAIRL